jgi:hypothetical protein
LRAVLFFGVGPIAPTRTTDRRIFALTRPICYIYFSRYEILNRLVKQYVFWSADIRDTTRSIKRLKRGGLA